MYTLFVRVYGKCDDGGTQATIKLMEHFIDHMHSITFNKGKEFACNKVITEALETTLYFEHPYHS